MNHHDAAPDALKTLMSRMIDFFRLQAAGGIILIIASALALIIANSPLYDVHHYILEEVKFRIGFATTGGYDVELNKSILLWINDGLMAVFFFLIGLEIKREVVDGELSSRDRALLPMLAAIGGMIIPAAVFWMINQGHPANLNGWAISSATDIAFAICIIALVGSRVPVSLKILLMAIAVIDDLGAILIIAVFYNHGFHAEPLIFAGIALLGLFLLNRRGVGAIIPYLLLGLVLWVAVLQSGIHATLAGVITALFIPLRDRHNPKHSPVKHLEHRLHPWVAFAVLPIFGFANAGVPFAGMTLDSLTDPLTLGITLGLLLGKPLGIFTVLFLAIKFRLSPMPQGANYIQLFGLSVLCGIGFTMSLFIGGLAFTGDDYQAAIRLGVLMGSLAAALIGYMILRHGPTSEVIGKDERFLKLMVQHVDFVFGKNR
ncbi:MAG: Na+/H+ antiporter NhaA [Micavibrio sp.]